jgi:cysteine desulfurase
LIHADPKEIIFTSGATGQSGPQGVAEIYQERRSCHACMTEHRSVLDTAKRLEKMGLKVTYLPRQYGMVIQ